MKKPDATTGAFAAHYSVTGVNHLILSFAALAPADGILQAVFTFIVEEGSGEIALVIGEKESTKGTLMAGDITVATGVINKARRKRRPARQESRRRMMTVRSAPFQDPAKGSIRPVRFKIFLTGTPTITISSLAIDLVEPQG